MTLYRDAGSTLTPKDARTKRPMQRDRVLQLLDKRKLGVSRIDAVRDIGTFELASRIGELEALGCTIERARFTGRNRFGDPVRGVLYILRHVPADVLADAKARVANAGQSWTLDPWL